MSQHRIHNRAAMAACLLLSLLLLRSPALAAQGFASGLRLCVDTVLPALFPFFVICEWLLTLHQGHSRLLRGTARLLGMQREEGALALLLAWFGGYAVCARLTGRLSRAGTLNARESALLMMLGCCSSPGFVIGCVGGLMLGSLRLGILLYGLQLAANLLSTLLCVPLLPPKRALAAAPPVQAEEAPAGFSQAVGSAVMSCLNVCGCVLFFRVVGAVAAPFLPQATPCPPAGERTVGDHRRMRRLCRAWRARGAVRLLPVPERAGAFGMGATFPAAAGRSLPAAAGPQPAAAPAASDRPCAGGRAVHAGRFARLQFPAGACDYHPPTAGGRGRRRFPLYLCGPLQGPAKPI